MKFEFVIPTVRFKIFLIDFLKKCRKFLANEESFCENGKVFDHRPKTDFRKTGKVLTLSKVFSIYLTP